MNRTNASWQKHHLDKNTTTPTPPRLWITTSHVWYPYRTEVAIFPTIWSDSLNFEKFDIKVENLPMANSEKVGFRSRLCKNIDISLPFTAYIRQNNPKSTLSWLPFYWTLELHHVIKNRDVFWYNLFLLNERSMSIIYCVYASISFMGFWLVLIKYL